MNMMKSPERAGRFDYDLTTIAMHPVPDRASGYVDQGCTTIHQRAIAS
jgi:hypothetical protein